MAEQLVSFDAVKQAVTIESVLRRYGYFDGLQPKGDQLVGLCPFHKEGREGSPSFKVTPSRNIWHCFSGACRPPRGGDVIDLVCAAEQISTGHRNSDRRCAALLLQEWFGLTPPAPENTKESRASQHRKKSGRAVDEQKTTGEAEQQDNAGPKSMQPEVINPPLGFTLKNLDYERAYAYAEGRGISRATAEHFGLAVALSGGYKGRLVIPLFDRRGEQEQFLVGYAARALDESEPKYLFPSRDKGFYKSHLVYNARMQGQRAVVVTEGFFDCMKVTQAGFPTVSIMGCDISEHQAELLCAHFSNLVLMFDGDAAGRQGLDRALVAIGRRGRYVRAVLLPDGCQPDQLPEEEIRRLLTR